MDFLILIFFIILTGGLIFLHYNLLFKKRAIDNEICLSEPTMVLIFFYFSIFLSLFRDLFSLVWNFEYSFSLDYLYGLIGFLTITLGALKIYHHVKFPLFKLFSSFLFSFFLSIFLQWTINEIFPTLRPFDDFKKYVLIYSDHEVYNEDYDSETQTQPMYLITKVSFNNNIILSDSLQILNKFPREKTIIAIGTDRLEVGFRYSFCFTKQYGKYRGYKSINIHENALEKWIFGGFLYFFEVIYESWIIILCNVILLYFDYKFNLFKKKEDSYVNY